MPRPTFASVDDYIASFPPEVRTILTEVREAIRSELPTAEERISYQIPAYKVGRAWVIYFGGFKKHFSLFCPQGDTVLARFEDELARYYVKNATFHFPLNEPVPADLIRRVAAHVGQAATLPR